MHYTKPPVQKQQEKGPSDDEMDASEIMTAIIRNPIPANSRVHLECNNSNNTITKKKYNNIVICLKEMQEKK